MKIRIEKKTTDKFLLYLATDLEIKCIYLSKEDLLKLKSNIDEMLEYGSQSTGDNL